MEEEHDFNKIGKQLPYTTPDGFFDRISEKTLQKAKQEWGRNRIGKVVLKVLITSTTAAAVLLIGFLLLKPEGSPKITKAASSTEGVAQQAVAQSQLEEVHRMEGVPKMNVVKEVKTVEEAVGSAEEVGDVLADLTDEELLQMAAMYRVDPFISEPE